ncbi:MAG: mRNA-degrading endonuclease, partial [Chlorobiales bacterium]|nr:mRNA-degrading endonuclease [Chlorobiales bacterium]
LHGVILTDHLKSLDWKTRKAEFVGKISLETIEAVLDKVGDLLEM